MALVEEPAEEEVPEWTLGDRLRKARTHRGIDQERMAEMLDVSAGTISNWETGRTHPRTGELELVYRWADITRVPRSWLVNTRWYTGDGPHLDILVNSDDVPLTLDDALADTLRAQNPPLAVVAAPT